MSGLELTRRQVIEAVAVCGLVTAGGCTGSGQDGAAPDAARESGGSVEAPTAHRLATRLSFGPTAELLTLAAGGVEHYLADQLDSDGAESEQMTELFDAIEARGEELYDDKEQGNDSGAAARRQVALQTVALRTVVGAAWSTRQLHAVMCDFWSDHLHVSISEQPTLFHVPAYDSEVIRTHALGSFTDLLLASARSAAMLTYLDGSRSRADGDNVPNENYARELMELHTVGVDGGYDETDVAEAAHILTGFSLQRRSDEFVYRADWHDLGPLAEGGDVLGFVPSAETGAAAVRDGEDFLAHLARLPQTARHICHRLAVRLVSDRVAADDDVVEAAAAAFSAEDTSIPAAVRSIVGSAEFADAPAVTRRPLDLVCASLRMGCSAPATDQLDALVRPVGEMLRSLGQLPWAWPAPNGYPLQGQAWLGAGAMVSRLNCAVAAAGGYGELDARPGTDLADGSAPIEIATTILGRDPSPALAEALASTAPTADQGAASASTLVRALVFASPDFQER